MPDSDALVCRPTDGFAVVNLDARADFIVRDIDQQTEK
jgi:hypothetical protein